jgi:putative DNA primase/helicase
MTPTTGPPDAALLGNIPAVLRQASRWLVWRAKPKGNGKTDKIPCSVATGAPCDEDDPANWASFTDALAYWQANREKFAGLGFALGGGFAGTDLDGCRDPETGETHPAALEIIRDLNSYSEVSPSRTGIKVFMLADLGDREGNKKKGMSWGGDVEIYWRERFFTVTGCHLKGTPPTVEPRQAELEALHCQVFGEQQPQEARPRPEPVPLDLSDSELLEAAFRASNGTEIRGLFEEPGQDGNSEGDARLAGMLSFYSGGDPATLERLMRSSKRWREKWDSPRRGETWIGRECRMALERHTGDFYAPRRSAPGPGSVPDPNERARAAGVSDQAEPEGQGAAARAEAVKVASRPATGLMRFNRTDSGNGEVIAHLYGDRLRYDEKLKRWLRWGEHLWEPATEGQLTGLAKRAARARYKGAPEGEEGDAERRWAFGSESKAKVEAALFMAKATAPIMDDGAGWDANPMLLGCPNGVVELATGTFRAGRPEDRLTLKVGVPYDPEAECPLWLQFLGDVFRGDAALQEFVWRALGYSLTGSTKEQLFFLLHGSGGNGKTKLLEVLRYVLGDFAHSAPFSLFDYSCRNQHPQALAQLEGRRFVTASEPSENCRLNEDRLKALAGGEPVTAHLMRQNDHTFENTAKVWLGVNYKPRVLDDSDGFWRKARLVPFTRRFVYPEKLEANPTLLLDPDVLPADRDIAEKLKAEATGILRWAVEGAALWATGGLREPDCVRVASEAWREEADPLGDFFASCCTIGEKCRVPAGDLYRAYCKWCDDLSMKEKERMTQTAFGRRIGARFKKDPKAFISGRQGPAYFGIGLAEEGE